jgi:hypothetical protein
MVLDTTGRRPSIDIASIWLIAFVVLLNALLAGGAAWFSVTGQNRGTQDETSRLLTRLDTELRDQKRSLTQEEQTRVIADFRLVVRTQAAAYAAVEKLLWSTAQIALLSSILLVVALVRILRARRAMGTV